MPRGEDKTTHGLSLLVEDRLGLTTVTGLLSYTMVSIEPNNGTSIHPSLSPSSLIKP